MTTKGIAALTLLVASGESWIVSHTGTSVSLAPPMSSSPAPILSASISQPVLTDPNYNLTVTASTLHDVAYKCNSVATGQVSFSGTLAVGTSTTSIKNVIEDLNCEVQGQYGTQAPLRQAASITIDCESKGQLKNPTTHRCEDFACKTVIVIAPDSANHYNVPARTTAGNCYSAKLMSKIANSDSTLTTAVDADFVSRDHSSGSVDYTKQHRPYMLGASLLGFIMRKGGGARSVKVSGSTDALSPILVDNFLGIGLAKKSLGLANASSYRAYGASDSTVDANSTSVKFNDQPVPLKSFGGSGISTISALDVTTQVSTEDEYSLDVRALDCGGSRKLSDIYLVFQ